VPSKPARSRRTLLIVGGLAAIAVVVALVVRQRMQLPQPGSQTYEEITGAFYRGLASLEVGLLDDAQREFTAATQLVPEEPASWANLGLSRLRLGELDAAAEPVGRALSLAPDRAELVLLAGRMEIARGRLDEGLAHLRRAVELEREAASGAQGGSLEARFGLAEEIERAAGPDADAQALTLLDELAQAAPDNPAVAVERARMAAKAGDRQKLATAIARLDTLAASWPERAVEQLRGLRDAAAANDLPRAQLATSFLRNVLTSVPSFRESLGAVRTPTELIAEPLDRFVRLAPPPATPSAPDAALTFQAETIGEPAATAAVLIAMPPLEQEPPRLFSGGGSEVVALTGSAVRLPFPRLNDAGPSGNGILAIDWNNDFRTDLLLAGEGGVRLHLQQEDGSFADATPAAAGSSPCPCFGAWGADVEMDGDLDVIVAPDRKSVV
jgi:tetratricopeptide (TPR) repeat protein